MATGTSASGRCETRALARAPRCDPSPEARRLRAAARGDRGARRRVVAGRLDLVHGIARRYRNMGLPDDDLVQEGSLGLLDAIDRYDPSRGLSFDAYAGLRIRRAILNALTEQSRLVRLPKHIVERQRVIARTEARLTAATGRTPAPAELAAATGLSTAAVIDARAAGIAVISLGAGVDADGLLPLEGLVADRAAPDPEQELLVREKARLVTAAVASLPPRQQEIVTHHYGLGRQAENLTEIAAELHLSPRRTQTIEHDALERLRVALPREL